MPAIGPELEIARNVRAAPRTRANPSGLIRCKVAESKSERTAAFRLVYENYRSKGMIPENVYQLRVTRHHLDSTTAVFVGTRQKDVVATVSLIIDGPSGLPMDLIQPDIGASARESGLLLGEVSCLAFRQLEFREFRTVFVEMTRLMTQYGRTHGIDQLIIGCVPRHARFYCQFLGFEQIGQPRPYSTVSNTIGVGCRLDFAKVDQQRPDCYEQYFGVRLPSSRLRAMPMDASERKAFAHVVELSEQTLTINA
jgi:hypothetical protein